MNIILVLVLLLVILFQYLLHKFLIIADSQKITFEYILNSQLKFVAIGLQLFIQCFKNVCVILNFKNESFLKNYNVEYQLF